MSVRPRRGDAGQNMLEYVGLVITVAAVLVLIGAGNGFGGLVPGAEKAVCKVINSADCRDEGLAPKTDADFKPDDCQVKTTQETHKGTVNLGIVKLGQDWALQKVMVRNKDGSVGYQVMMTAGGQAGVEGGLGGRANFNTDKVGAEIKVGADATFGHGDMWEFKSQEEMDKFSAGLHQAWLDNIQEGSTPGYEVGKVLRDDEPLPDPTYKIAKGGLQGFAEGEFSFPTGETGKDGKPVIDPNTGKTRKKESPEAKAKITPSGEVTTMTNGKDGSTVTTQQFKLEGEATRLNSKKTKGGKATGNANASGLGSVTGAMTITRDKNGAITQIKFVHTVEAGARGELEGTAGGVDPKGPQGQKEGGIKGTETLKNTAVVTKSLDVDASNRDAVNEWLSANNDAGTVAKSMAESVLAARDGVEYPPGPGADPMDRLLYEQGKTTRASYASHAEALEASARIRAGWTFGASFSSERSTESIVDGDYLGAPDADGGRRYVDFPECHR
ncbi:MAG: hypothetical protein GEV11_20235 [Streptosporangiales bacterium]|nr:hypothetical protein [Streptosporangiales bacterium]